MTSSPQTPDYPARLAIDYPDRELDRVSSAFRILWVLPVLVVATLIGEAGAGAGGVLFFALLLMILFRQKYPRWWFDFALEATRFTTRVGAYLLLMSDEYPSTDEEQYVHVDIDYPDATRLNRWLPLVKWFLAIPHYVVLAVLYVGAFFALIGAWFAILFTGRYPRGIFDYIEGVLRWTLRVDVYVSLLVTDRYPPFALR